MVSRKHAASADEALALGTLLVQANLLCHVCDDHEFKNDFLFYRFAPPSINHSLLL